jgi:hypothetical protein
MKLGDDKCITIPDAMLFVGGGGWERMKAGNGEKKDDDVPKETIINYIHIISTHRAIKTKK